MKWFNVEWVTHNKTAGGQGKVEADDIEDAKARTREIVAKHNEQLTADEIEKLEITVTEVL